MTNEASIQHDVESRFGMRLESNKLRDVARLAHEISVRERVSPHEILEEAQKELDLRRYSPRDAFVALRRVLIARRFPETSARISIPPSEVYSSPLPPLPAPESGRFAEFRPAQIYMESSVRKSDLARRVRERYPDTPLTTLKSLREYSRTHRFSPLNVKTPLLFLVREPWDFHKPCPCTKSHVRCGYWILNLGFGCPYDCSYCFLQHYANVPGIILPANVSDFFERFDSFLRTRPGPLRLGTGEFCDSLALDPLTEYSLQLIPYFRAKPDVYFEFKTKSACIDNILRMSPADNIVISWSLNPPDITAHEEPGTASLDARLEAARKVRQAGYRIAFHFDPLIHMPGWETEYRALVSKLYSYLRPPFAWISLGTLRAHRKIKSIWEQRFPESTLFYGELLLGGDGKLRYPEFIRRQIYAKMREWLREKDGTTPVYLCMETQKMWRECIGEVRTPEEISGFLTGNNP
ncbi:MAG: hypothetical protein GF333_05850 [Candidatus Omnitrophica bacterium]|nr:hypothetical protein [Candidatus Omnitrophota bacterium]